MIGTHNNTSNYNSDCERVLGPQPWDENSCLELVQRIAQRTVELRLEVPALIFLELLLPVTTLLHTGALLFQPIFAPIFGAERLRSLEQLLSDRSFVSELLSAIDRLASKRTQSLTSEPSTSFNTLSNQVPDGTR